MIPDSQIYPFIISSSNRSGQMVVESLLPGGPAHSSNKIDVGDELVEVNGKEVITMSLGGVRHMIRCAIIAGFNIGDKG